MIFSRKWNLNWTVIQLNQLSIRSNCVLFHELTDHAVTVNTFEIFNNAQLMQIWAKTCPTNSSISSLVRYVFVSVCSVCCHCRWVSYYFYAYFWYLRTRRTICLRITGVRLHWLIIFAHNYLLSCTLVSRPEFSIVLLHFESNWMVA